ncbi:hypothetical protein SEA_ZOOMAN_282 [Microbacterium phage Zooman]|nr:hypothetical protein SEA_ZOOMAN_282 [Microbacterium phage Zooman]
MSVRYDGRITLIDSAISDIDEADQIMEAYSEYSGEAEHFHAKMEFAANLYARAQARIALAEYRRGA